MASPPASTSGSDCSFHTAPSSPISISIDSDVAMADADNETEVSQESACPYRPGKPITDEIRQHCHIFLDEGLYPSALTLLSDLVTAGASHPDAQDIPAYIPLPYHIELVSALLIHPHYTNQAPPGERVELASKSITFLRNILYILGPVNANLVEAFSLAPTVSGRAFRRSRNTREIQDGTSGSDSDEKPEKMMGIIAGKGRIRTCAKDFWHMVGWAFNCSVKHPKRWQYWKVYLDYMLDVLDMDWKERERLDREAILDPNAECDFKMVREGLLMNYLSDVKGRSSAVKRVVRSAFADGGLDSMKEFPEVFENETKDAIFNGQKRKRAETIDQTSGDYDEDSGLAGISSSPIMAEDEDEEDDDEMAVPEVDPYLGGMESIALRQRFLTLFSRAFFHLPDELIDLEELYEIMYLSLKRIPVPAFSLFMSPSLTSNMHPEFLISLSAGLLLRFLPNNAPTFRDVPGNDGDNLNQAVLEKCCLPFPAITSSTEDNAKVSIMGESFFRMYLRNYICWHTPDLDEAIEKGILARETKIKADKKPKDLAARKRQDMAREWLKASSGRLRSLLAFVEKKTAEDWNRSSD